MDVELVEACVNGVPVISGPLSFSIFERLYAAHISVCVVVSGTCNLPPVPLISRPPASDVRGRERRKLL